MTASPAGFARRSWILGGFLIALVATTRPFGADPDTWWHLAVGRLIDHQGIPSVEPFAFAHAAYPWVGQQWLYEVFLSHTVGGSSGGVAVIVMGVLGALAFAISASLTPASVPGWPIGASMALTSFVAIQVMGVRGQVVTVAGSAATLWILARWRVGDKKIVWLLPPLMLLWCNLHAGFVTGLVMIAAFLVMPRRPSWGIAGDKKILALATVVALGATLINPAGPRLYPYIVDTFTNPVLTQSITEWLSPDFHQFFLRLFEASVIALVVFWVVADGVVWSDVVLGLGAVAGTLQAQRNVAIYALIATPQLAHYGYSSARKGHARLLQGPARTWYRDLSRVWLHFISMLADRARITAAVFVVATAGIVTNYVAPAITGSDDGTYEAMHSPVKAASYYAEHFGGQRLYATYELGGYLAYRFPRGRVVYIYGESAIFGASTLQQYTQIHFLGSNWNRVLASLQATHAIVGAASQEAGAFAELGWRIDCRDPAGYVLMSVHPPPRSSAAQTTPPVVLSPSC